MLVTETLNDDLKNRSENGKLYNLENLTSKDWNFELPTLTKNNDKKHLLSIKTITF